MKRTTREISVAILGINGADSPSPGLILSQTLRRQSLLPVRILALVGNPFTDGIQAVNHADETVVVPSPEASPQAFVDRVAELARRAAPLVLLPGGTSEWLTLIPLGRKLQARNVSLLFPPDQCVKELLPLPSQKTLGKGVRLPKHAVLRSPNIRPLLKVAWRFPVRLRASDGTAGVAATWEELELKLAQPRSHPSSLLLIQEIAPGEEISVAALGDRRGRPVGWVAVKVLSRSDNGALWSAVTVDSPVIQNVVKPLLTRFAWPGPLTLSLSFAAGVVYLSGIEPGFPSWISLAAAAGQDLSLHYLRLALGTSVLQVGSYRPGLFLARVAVDQPTNFQALGQLVIKGECVNANDRSITLRATADYTASSRHH
jgi:hypothetical protein